MIEVYHEPKRELEFALCDILTNKVGLRFYPNYGNEARETPFGAVICEEAKPLTGGMRPRAYLCNVKVVFVSHIDEADSQEHGGYISKMEDALMLIPNKVEDEFNRYLRRDELYGYSITPDVINKHYDKLKSLLVSKTIKIYNEDPVLLAKEMREGIYASAEINGPLLNSPDHKDFVVLGSHYTFEPKTKDGYLLCNFNRTTLRDRYILARRQIQISGLYINQLSAKAEDQSFGDVFDCTIGITEIC